MSTPICHRTLGPMVRSYGDGEPRDQQAFGCPCIGSACVLWVPAYKKGRGGDTLAYRQTEDHLPTGSGWCNDNVRGNPWPDPAEPVKAGGAS